MRHAGGTRSDEIGAGYLVTATLPLSSFDIHHFFLMYQLSLIYKFRHPMNAHSSLKPVTNLSCKEADLGSMDEATKDIYTIARMIGR